MESSTDEPSLATIGHSNLTTVDFLSSLTKHGIDAIADVRTHPVSSYLPHFNKEPLKASLQESGFSYVFLGEELGGRPTGASHYDSAGFVLYDQVAKSALFQTGLRRLLEGASNFKIGVMCSEGVPDNCHRHLLIARVLDQQGISVEHVLPDGSTKSASDLLAEHRPLPTLFGQEEQSWKSAQSALPSTPQKTSSAS